MREPDVLLNEYTKEEWFDLCREMKPDLTWGEFLQKWNEFQGMKEKRKLQ